MRRTRKEMDALKKEFYELMTEGGSITRMSMSQMARFIRVSYPTIAKWLDERGYKRWGK